MKSYSIKKGYTHRSEIQFYDDMNCKDEFQNEIYELVYKMFPNCKSSILDYGCGSGFKLIKYFKKYEFIGVDIEPHC